MYRCVGSGCLGVLGSTSSTLELRELPALALKAECLALGAVPSLLGWGSLCDPTRTCCQPSMHTSMWFLETSLLKWQNWECLAYGLMKLTLFLWSLCLFLKVFTLKLCSLPPLCCQKPLWQQSYSAKAEFIKFQHKSLSPLVLRVGCGMCRMWNM